MTSSEMAQSNSNVLASTEKKLKSHYELDMCFVMI